MRLGLLADIHEAVEPLRAAVRELEARQVDAYVMLGDVLEYASRVEETVAILTGLPGPAHARVFAGHLHGWGVFTPERELEWIGEGLLSYRSDERYLTVVHAVCEGWCAILDTGRDELVPIRVAAPREGLRGAEGL